MKVNGLIKRIVIPTLTSLGFSGHGCSKNSDLEKTMDKDSGSQTAPQTTNRDKDIDIQYCLGMINMRAANSGGNPLLELSRVYPADLYRQAEASFINVLRLPNKQFPNKNEESYHLMALRNLQIIEEKLGNRDMADYIRTLLRE